MVGVMKQTTDLDSSIWKEKFLEVFKSKDMRKQWIAILNYRLLNNFNESFNELIFKR